MRFTPPFSILLSLTRPRRSPDRSPPSPSPSLIQFHLIMRHSPFSGTPPKPLLSHPYPNSLAIKSTAPSLKNGPPSSQLYSLPLHPFLLSTLSAWQPFHSMKILMPPVPQSSPDANSLTPKVSAGGTQIAPLCYLLSTQSIFMAQLGKLLSEPYGMSLCNPNASGPMISFTTPLPKTFGKPPLGVRADQSNGFPPFSLLPPLSPMIPPR